MTKDLISYLKAYNKDKIGTQFLNKSWQKLIFDKFASCVDIGCQPVHLRMLNALTHSQCLGF